MLSVCTVHGHSFTYLLGCTWVDLPKGSGGGARQEMSRPCAIQRVCGAATETAEVGR